MTDEGPEIAGIALKGIFDRKGLDPAMFDAYDRTPDPNATGIDCGLIDAWRGCRITAAGSLGVTRFLQVIQAGVAVSGK